VGEDERPGPERLELGAQLVGERDPRLDEVLARARERPQRPCLVGVGADRAQPMGVGSGQLGEHERVEAIRLAVGDRVALPGRLRLIGMDRDHDQTCIEQPVDHDPVRALDRHPLHLKLDQLATERRDPGLVVRDYSLPQPRAGRVDHADRVLLAGPVDSRNVCHAALLGRVP
jgi:hypothetical protein